jgi:hypothetical protein
MVRCPPRSWSRRNRRDHEFEHADCHPTRQPPVSDLEGAVGEYAQRRENFPSLGARLPIRREPNATSSVVPLLPCFAG